MDPLDPVVVGIVKAAAAEFSGRGLDPEDLVGEAWVGAIEACRLHDGGDGFPGYVKQRVRGAILDAIRRSQWVAIEKHALARHRRGEHDETADQAGAALRCRRQRADDGGDLTDELALAPADVELPAVLDAIDAAAAAVIILRCGLDGGPWRSLREVAGIVGKSFNQVAHLERVAKRQLREAYCA